VIVWPHLREMMMIWKSLQSLNVEITLSRLMKGGRQTLSREGIWLATHQD